MYVINTGTGSKDNVEILELDKSDYKRISVKSFHFDWSTEVDYSVYKLVHVNTKEILGLVSLDEIDEESRVEIRLLASSRQNTGTNKQYERVAGNLISFAARVAIKEFGSFACISLKPKTKLRDYYKKTYTFKEGGVSLFVQGIDLLKLGMEYE